MEEKLTIEHLAPYLPYGLKICACESEYEMTIEDEMDSETICLRDVIENNHKPILRPLSDLKEFSPAIWKYGMLDSEINPTLKLTYNEIYVLFKNHFDVFGLIEQGLAIDINTINN